jgi:hypothetical protein
VTTGVLIVVLILIGLLLAAVDQLKARGQSVTDWAVIAASLALLLWRLA